MDNPAPTRFALISRRALEDVASSYGNATGFSARRRPAALTEDSHLTVAVKGDWLKSRVREIRKHGSVRGVKFFYMAESCGTPQSKERSNREYKACLNERALRLLDQFVGLRPKIRNAKSEIRQFRRLFRMPIARRYPGNPEQ